jgi:ubiquinone/menaquinone biosynthesis C-methylase UbiE
VDEVTQRKWDRAAVTYDWMNAYGPEWRWGEAKRRLFSRMRGKVLFMAVGTGQDIHFFPPGRDIVGIDISNRMLERARPRAEAYHGSFELRHLDVHDLDSDPGLDRTFDQVFTSCTFCSVPRPIDGLRALRRVLVPGGDLCMFEHTGSRYFPFNVMLSAMNPLVRKVGPEINRDTVSNVAAAGFEVRAVENVYLDVVRMVHAVSPTR